METVEVMSLEDPQAERKKGKTMKQSKERDGYLGEMCNIYAQRRGEGRGAVEPNTIRGKVSGMQTRRWTSCRGRGGQ